MTALHFAADRGYLAIVKLLISSGANVNVQDLEGNSPLMLAAACEHEVIHIDFFGVLGMLTDTYFILIRKCFWS